jgi:hypothetical protein
LHSVRTGETGFARAHGQDVWSFRSSNAEESALFDLAMRENSRDIAREMLAAYDFTQTSHIVDIGGGNGALIAGLLAGCPHLTGTLLDLPHVVVRAVDVLEEAGVQQRCNILAGSFFEGVPAGGDVYVLKSILHDWGDREVHDILSNCKQAMRSGARLLVVDRVVSPPNEGAEGKLSDLNMLVTAGGLERTSEEFAAIFAGAGFQLRAIISLPSSRSIIEASPSQ